MPRYEFVEGRAMKFWAAAVDGEVLTIRSGRVGTRGRAEVKRLATAEAAKREHDRRVAELLARVVSGGAKPAAALSLDPDRASALPGAHRFEHAKTSRFVELLLDGPRAILRREGRIGSAGRRSRKTYRTAEKAEDAVRYCDLLRKGWEVRALPVAVAPSLENAALADAIVGDPDDEQALLVYGDWLQSQGDPRGELIALQQARKEKAAAQWIEDHAPSLLGPLQPWVKRLDALDGKPAFAWRRGFIDAAHLAFDYYKDGTRGTLHLDEALDALLAHPSGRFLRRLTLGANAVAGQRRYGALLEVLAKRGAPCLSHLHVADFDRREVALQWTELGSFARVLRATPRLETLIVQGAKFVLGKIALPALRQAEIRAADLSREAARSIATAAWPNLESLEVWFGAAWFGCDCTAADVTPILDGRNLPRLTRLALKSAEFADELARLLPKAKLLPRLRALDFSNDELTDDGARHLLANRAAFAHLETLTLSRRSLSPKTVERLKTLCKKVIVIRQQEVEARYDAVDE